MDDRAQPKPITQPKPNSSVHSTESEPLALVARLAQALARTAAA